MWIFCFFSSFIIAISLGASPPDFIKPCQFADEACLKASLQLAIPHFMLGLPEQGVEVLDPSYLPLVQFNISGLQFKLDNGTVKGWKNVVVKKIKLNKDTKTIAIDYHSDYVVRGHYIASGQLLILPISGNGDFKLKIKGLHIKIDIPYKVMTKENGMQHLFLKRHKFIFDAKESAQYTLTNLFQGNKELGAAMHNFLNQNWKIVTQEFGTPVLGASIEVVLKNVQNFFNRIPINELSLM